MTSDQPEQGGDLRPMDQKVVEDGIVLLRSGQLDNEKLVKFYWLISSSTLYSLADSTGSPESIPLLPDEKDQDTVVPIFTSRKRAEEWAKNYKHPYSSIRVPMPSVLFRVGEEASIVINPADDQIHLYMEPKTMTSCRDLYFKNFPVSEGGYYLVMSGSGMAMTKLLKKDDNGFHLRYYDGSYPLDIKEFPTLEEVQALPVKIGHCPVSNGTFMSHSPIFVAEGTSSEEELQGYNTWSESQGGYF